MCRAYWSCQQKVLRAHQSYEGSQRKTVLTTTLLNTIFLRSNTTHGPHAVARPVGENKLAVSDKNFVPRCDHARLVTKGCNVLCKTTAEHHCDVSVPGVACCKTRRHTCLNTPCNTGKHYHRVKRIVLTLIHGTCHSIGEWAYIRTMFTK